MFRAHWWAAVATVARLVGDLEVAEDAVQDACAAALTQWPAAGIPGQPRAWLISVARHKATDRLRRERRRLGKETSAALEVTAAGRRRTGCPAPTTSLASSSPAATRPSTRRSGCR